MIILVTTSQSLLTVDIESGETAVAHRGQGLYYGIAYSNDEIFVAARGRPVSPKEERATEAGSILVFDYALNLKRTLRPTFALRDMHQIVYYDGCLWVTCAYDDRVAIYDGDAWRGWHPAPVSSEPDTFHFNSIIFADDHLFLLAHNNGASDIWKFAYPELRLIEKMSLGNLSHNIWKEDGVFFTCSSGEGRILSSAGLDVPTGGFPRGIVVCPGAIVVGVSESVERDERDFTSSALHVFDSNWNFQKEIKLPTEGLVLEIRAPGFADICSSNSRGQRIALPSTEAI